jgi:hypothetical protein
MDMNGNHNTSLFQTGTPALSHGQRLSFFLFLAKKAMNPFSEKNSGRGGV